MLQCVLVSRSFLLLPMTASLNQHQSLRDGIENIHRIGPISCGIHLAIVIVVALNHEMQLLPFVKMKMFRDTRNH